MLGAARLDVEAIRDLARELGVTRPLNLIPRQGAFVKECACPDPTHKGRRFVGFHSVRDDGEHYIEIDVTQSPQRVTEIIAHEAAHAAQWERGQREPHDNTLPYHENPRELDADAAAAEVVRSGRSLVVHGINHGSAQPS